jgi:glycosyltransferase involved in cell wall biosynthesis
VRIAIDARELAGRPTGVGRYVSEILAAWSQLPGASGYEFVLCAPAAVDLPRAGGLRLTSEVAAGGGTLWEQFTLPRLLRRARPDVLWAPAYTGPLRPGVPMVLTIHDVSFAAHPEWFSWREGTRRRLITRLAARRAVRIITVSDFSKREIVHHLGVDRDSVDVIYSGATLLADGDAPIAATPPVRDRSRPPLVLYVGSIFNRRHVPELIDGFARLARRHPGARLEIVGDNRTHPYIDIDAEVRRAGVNVRVHAYVSDSELAALYAEASALAFLSDYEGFGFTPLEALAAGIPIVVLDTPVAREIYGPAAVYVPLPDAAAIERGLVQALFDEEVRAQVLAAAPTVLPRYSWRECAQRTLQVLGAAAAK